MTPDASGATTAVPPWTGELLVADGLAVGEDAAVREGAIGVTLRDIARGGIAGVIAGAVVAGVGGRVVMRLAAVAVPDSRGGFTENGFVIGLITPASLGLVVFGTFAGLIVGAFWVAVATWIPGTGVRRALATMPLAVAVGGVGLVEGSNSDFRVLQNDPLVVAMLIGLVAAVGFVVALADEVLDRRLPAVATSRGRVVVAYAVLAGIGALITLPILAGGLFGGAPPRVAMSLALVVAGGATLLWWKRRADGVAAPSERLTLVARLALVAVVILGTIDLLPEVGEALRLP
jgi:hypothetical protein